MKSLIHSFFQPLRRFTLYRKLVLSFMTLLAIFSVLIVTLLYTLFTHVLHQEYKYMAQSSLVSADSVLQNSYDKLGGVINEVLSLPNLPVFFLESQADRVNEASIFSELRRLKSLYPYIEKISLINFYGERYLGTDGASYAVDDSIVKLYEKSRESGMISYRRIIQESVRLDNSPNIQVTTFVFFPSGQYRDGAIVLDLRDEYFIQLLNPAIIHPQDQVVLVTNENVLIAWNPIVEINEVLLDDIQEDDFRIMDVSGIRCAVTMREACIPGWKLVRVMPMVGSGILTRRLSIQLSCALLLFLMVVVYGGWRRIRKIYNPVSTMVKEQVESQDIGIVDEISLIYEELIKRSYEIEKLTSRLNHSKTLFNGSWVKSQLLGDEETAKKVEALAREQGTLPKESGSRCVAVLSIDHYQQYSRTADVGERGLHDFAIANIFNELLGNRILGGLIRMDEQKLACLLLCPSGVVEASTLESMREFQNNFSTYFKQTVSIGIGTPGETLEETARSYRQACSALQYRFYRGTNSLNIYGSFPEIQKTGYPAKEEREMLESILVQDEKGLFKAQALFIQALGKQEESRAKGYVERCMNNLISALAIRSVLVPHDDIHQEVYAAETMRELGSLLRNWGEVMLLRCEEELRKDKPEEENSVIFAQKYINDHYSEGDLSVEFLARLVNLSPSYFGKQFYSTLHVSCNDYIADVRLENAARLLRETTMSVQEISEQVGVGSINYFYRLFKKKYGETPISYRKKENRRI